MTTSSNTNDQVVLGDIRQLSAMYNNTDKKHLIGADDSVGSAGAIVYHHDADVDNRTLSLSLNGYAGITINKDKVKIRQPLQVQSISLAGYDVDTLISKRASLNENNTYNGTQTIKNDVSITGDLDLLDKSMVSGTYKYITIGKRNENSFCGLLTYYHDSTANNRFLRIGLKGFNSILCKPNVTEMLRPVTFKKAINATEIKLNDEDLNDLFNAKSNIGHKHSINDLTDFDISNLDLGSAAKTDVANSFSEHQTFEKGITSNDVITAASFASTSDIRKKCNIKKLTKAEVDAILNEIETYSFNLNQDYTQRKHYGVIAQDLVKIAPELVHEDESTQKYMTINYTEFVPLLIEKVKDQEKRIKALEEQLAKLTSSN